MADRILIPLPGIGTLSLTRVDYEAALIPFEPTVPKPSSLIAVANNPKYTPSLTPRQDDTLRLRYIRLREVCARVGLRPSTIYNLISQKKFPTQVRLSARTAAWVESEVEAYMDARIIERDTQARARVHAESPYLRMGEVMKLTGLNSSSIYELIRNGEFPKWAAWPKIASGWHRAEVVKWLSSRSKASK